MIPTDRPTDWLKHNLLRILGELILKAFYKHSIIFKGIIQSCPILPHRNIKKRVPKYRHMERES